MQGEALNALAAQVERTPNAEHIRTDVRRREDTGAWTCIVTMRGEDGSLYDVEINRRTGN